MSQSMEYRYHHDPQIHALVDLLESSIAQLNFTPSEIRDCAMLATIHYEQRRQYNGCNYHGYLGGSDNGKQGTPPSDLG